MGYCTYPGADLAGEPTLEELFGEPIIHLIMKRDGVAERDMRTTLESLRRAYRAAFEIQ